MVGAPAAQLHLVAPSSARPGETVRLHVSALDARGSRSPLEDGGVVFVEPPAGISLPESVDLGGEHGGTRTLDVQVQEPGLYRLRVQGTGSIGHLSAESGPLLVREDAPRVK